MDPRISGAWIVRISDYQTTADTVVTTFADPQRFCYSALALPTDAGEKARLLQAVQATETIVPVIVQVDSANRCFITKVAE